jgi:hypothetical protein
MNIPDIQILKLIEILKGSGVIRFDTDFCEAIGLLKQNLVKIRAPYKLTAGPQTKRTQESCVMTKGKDLKVKTEAKRRQKQIISQGNLMI